MLVLTLAVDNVVLVSSSELDAPSGVGEVEGLQVR